MRIRARRLLSASLVVVSACGALEVATLQQNVLTSPDNPYSFGSNLTVGVMYSHAFTVSETDPTTTNISGVTPGSGCTHFAITAGSGQACGGAGVGCDAYVMTACPSDYMFSVTFTPAFAGLETCDITVNGTTSTGSEDYPMTLSGAAMGSSFSMTVMPVMVPFGDQPIGTTSAAQTVTVTNTGSATLDIVSTINQVGSAFIGVTGTYNASHPLGSGSSESYQIACNPPNPVGYDGTLSVIANEGPMGSAALSCMGIVTTLGVNPTPAAFGTTLVGGHPNNVILDLSSSTPTSLMMPPTLDANAVTAGVSVVSTTNTGGFGSGSDATVTLGWNPTAPATGQLGTVTLKTMTDMRVVTITGIAQPGSIATNPADVDLGPICIGGSASATLDVYASDVGDVTLGGASAMGAMFTLDTGSLAFPYRLGGDHNGDAMMTVSAAPGSNAAVGEANGAIALVTNIPPSPSTTNVAVHATVLAGGLGASPNAIAFGTVPVLKPSSPKMTTLANCSGSPLTITATQITGPNAADFVIVSPDSTQLTGTLANTMSQQYSIVMLPQTKGQKMADLEIDYGSGQSFTIPLTGNAGSDTTSKDRETYYACSAGGGAAGGALWPIAVAGAWLARRRKRR